MSFSTDDLQIVVIESFYDTMDQEESREWLGELFRFKVNAYRESQPYGILPFGSTDLIGINWILCKKQTNHLEPIMGFKTIDSKQTDLFRMEFPAFSIAGGADSALHRQAIEHELKKARANDYGLGYIGSWTIDSAARKTPDLSKFCKKMTSALLAQWVHHFNVQAAITFANLRFRVDQFHAYLGLTRLTLPNGESLSNFNSSAIFDEPVCASILKPNQLSENAKRDALELNDLWEKRIVLAQPNSVIAVPKKPEPMAA